jgi:hypothetical protein
MTMSEHEHVNDNGITAGVFIGITSNTEKLKGATVETMACDNQSFRFGDGSKYGEFGKTWG